MLFSLLNGLERPHTLVRCLRSISVARTVRRGCPTEVLYGIILRFHEPPPPTPFPVMGEWSFSEADAVEEGKRRRQRCSRSREARHRRLGRGEPNTIGHEEFTILHPNVRGFISQVAELGARLRLMVSKPSVLCLTETWADKGLPSMRIEGYTHISRRDRADGRLGGVVAVFALERVAHRVTLLENSQVAERSWVIIHSDHGPYVIGCWYRPPAPGEVDSIRSFKEEAQSHATSAVGCVLLGALNIHLRKWLKYSNRNCLKGQELCAVCKELGLTQLVHEPTRGDHLLDLVLSSFSGVKAGVLPLIADHKPVAATLKLSVPSQVEAGRRVWRYGQADWERLHDSLADACWDHIADQSTTAAAKWITGTILRSASSCIPLSTLRTKKSSHPWQCRSRSSLSRLHRPCCAENALYQAFFPVVVEEGQGSYET